jgi:NTE family protein
VGKGRSDGSLDDASLRRVLEEVLGTDDPAALDDVAGLVDREDLESGQVLYRQGDPADAVHVLLRGRLRALAADAQGVSRVIGDIGRGETVGEMALVAGGTRTATVIAVRDSILLALRRDAVEEVLTRHPKLALSVARLSVERMRRALHQRRRAARARCVAVLPHRRVRAPEAFARSLCESLARAGSAALLEPSSAAGATPGETAGRLEAAEVAHDTLVLLADAAASPWTEACLRQADLVLLVAEAGDDPAPGEVERLLPTPVSLSSAPERVLVLLHPEGAGLPERTAAWLDPRPGARHHHVRRNRPGDVDRLARFLSGRAVGLVLAGGGAPGLVHVGVVRALRERGVPIDAVCGTSIGSLLAAGVARGWDDAALVREAKAAFGRPDPLGDWNLVPVASLSKGKRMTGRIRARFAGADIEDLWLPFFCVSADLSTNQECIHRRGSLWRALRTSASIPGVLPPVVHGDHLHVDGSSVNNLPVGAMVDTGVGRVIASDLDLRVERRLGYDEVPSSWAILRGRFLPWARRYPVPGMVSVVMKSTMLGGMQRAVLSRSEADLVLVPPVGKTGLLDWGAFDRVAELGYRYASERLARVDPESLEEIP